MKKFFSPILLFFAVACGNLYAQSSITVTNVDASCTQYVEGLVSSTDDCKFVSAIALGTIISIAPTNNHVFDPSTLTGAYSGYYYVGFNVYDDASGSHLLATINWNENYCGYPTDATYDGCPGESETISYNSSTTVIIEKN